MAADNGDLCFEEGVSWLLSEVLDEACHAKAHFSHHHHHHHHRHHGLKLQTERLPQEQSKSIGRPNYRTSRAGINWATGGPGMQAIFLESGRRSGGTGVFLPRTAATNFQPIKKPACSPVLVPSRVVQALNLNVHALGLQISPSQERKSSNKGGGCYTSGKCRSGKDVSSTTKYCSVISQNQNSSADIFLPKEWTY